jgi:hypothetical protein
MYSVFVHGEGAGYADINLSCRSVNKFDAILTKTQFKNTLYSCDTPDVAAI